jgi:hypothetical protein
MAMERWRFAALPEWFGNQAPSIFQAVSIAATPHPCGLQNTSVNREYDKSCFWDWPSKHAISAMGVNLVAKKGRSGG